MSKARDLSNLLSTGSGTQTYATIAELPLTDNTTGAQAFVSENNRLYIWSGTGWYNIALVNTSPTAITGASGSYAFATDGTPIEITLVSTDPEGIPITWSYSVTSGSLTNGGGTTATVSQAANVFTITPSTNEDYTGSFSLTFTASDGVNLATATSSFTLEFKILNSRYTTLMLKAEAAGSNTTFVDSSTNNFTITRNGNTTQGTFSPYGDNWSNYFDGTGDYLSSAYSSALGTQDFSVEAWLYYVSGAGGWVGNRNTTTSGAFSSRLTSTTVSIGLSSTSNYNQQLITGTLSSLTNKWAHIVICRTSGTTSIFVDGIRQATTTSSLNWSFNNTWVIGHEYSGSSAADYLGYISNFRLVVGSSAYDATQASLTIPTAPLTAITGTSLLTCQSNRFKDSSANNYTVTPNGSVSVQRFSPFDIESYDPAVIGGSAYFDGSGDYLSPPSNAAFAFGTGAYTVEAWVYRTATDSDTSILFSAASATGAFNFGINPNGALILSNYGTGPVVTGNAGDVPLNSWCHIVAVRSSTSANDTKLYANGVLKVTGTDANTWTVSSSPIIGGFTTVSNYDFIGYISNFRIVKGTAVYTSNFTPPTEPLTAIANTSLLLKNTNAGIYDTSGNNDIETVGNAQVSTAITKYGSSSMYFDGSGDYLNSPSNQNLVFGTGDFTIEGWFYLTASAASIKYLFDCRSGGGIQAAPLVHIDSGTFKYYVNGSYVASGGTVTQNQWMHIALVKTSGSTKLYVNGNLAFTYTDSINYTSSTVRVGSEWSAAGTYDWAGYISDFRITKGLARYTANFTPPTSELKG